MKENETKSFVDIKFFLGLILLIYGLILTINGLFFYFTNVFEFSQDIDLFYGLFLFVIGSVFYRKSSKPERWKRALAHSGMENVEKRMKWPRKIKE
ncbi:MAG: hypothetical protein L6M37_05715 [Candidatus Methylarchaceae archaeon HK02M1]|nr:hypothetical protein [Candidatus Methylarchaceae archaeon HK01M]MCP8312429.1 hypothetical protein [Candidatus Methylarchaceae archaeon HK02M1]